jgi:hypothetical protein
MRSHESPIPNEAVKRLTTIVVLKEYVHAGS